MIGLKTMFGILIAIFKKCVTSIIHFAIVISTCVSYVMEMDLISNRLALLGFSIV